jgi:cytochrome c oxidase cbb3-type subunit 4
VNSLKDYFHTEWSAMTLHDWLGMGVTVVVFLVMVGLYAYIFHPANKQRLESQRYIPLDDGDDVQKHSPQHFPQQTEEQK